MIASSSVISRMSRSLARSAPLIETSRPFATTRMSRRPLSLHVSSSARVRSPGSASTIRSMVVVSQHSKHDNSSVTETAASKSSSSPMIENTTFLNNNNDNAPPLIVTDSTWNRIRQLNEKKGVDQYLRVFVDAGGCSGFSYVFELSQEDLDPDEDLEIIGPTGLKVVVDEGSLNLIRGSTIDYIQEMIKSSFEVRDNPQSESACGCGSSFAVKNFAANPALD